MTTTQKPIAKLRMCLQQDVSADNQVMHFEMTDVKNLKSTLKGKLKR